MRTAHARAFGDERYGANTDVQRDVADHCPVYKVHRHGVLCAIKIVPFANRADAICVRDRLAWANAVCSGLVVPIKAMKVHLHCLEGTPTFMLEVVTQWSPLTTETTWTWIAEQAYSLTRVCLLCGRYYNDLTIRNLGMLGFFDIDDAFGPFGSADGCYASHSTLILLWWQAYDPTRMVREGDPALLSLDEKGCILGNIAPSGLTQLLILAEFYRTLGRRLASASDEHADAVVLLRRIRGCIGPEPDAGYDVDTIVRLALTMFKAAKRSCTGVCTFTDALQHEMP